MGNHRYTANWRNLHTPGTVEFSSLSGMDVNLLKIYLILYADGLAVFAGSYDEFQLILDALLEYCNPWKLVVNTRTN